MKISVVIRCCNEERHIGRLLAGIGQQTERDHEVIVVDSGSTDATLAIASRFPVRIVSIKKEDFSFGYALNVGCENATGRFLVIVSAHAYPLHQDWIERLLQPFADEQVGLVYGKQLGSETTRFSELQIFRKWFPDHSISSQSHPFCNNANAAVRKDLFERFRYDETLTGLEDLAFAKNLLGAGYKIAYQAEAEVVHVHNDAWKSLANRYRREAIALREILPQEQFGLLSFFRLYITSILSDCSLAVSKGVFMRNVRSILLFRLMQFWGTYRGFAQHGTVSRQLKERFYYPGEKRKTARTAQKEISPRKAIDYKELKEATPEKDP